MKTYFIRCEATGAIEIGKAVDVGVRLQPLK
jgi:hypothetical protein